MSIRLLLLRVLGCLALLVGGVAHAASAMIVLDTAPSQDFSANAEVLIEDTGALSAVDVAALDDRFRPVQGADLHRRYDARVFWLRATLHNPGHESTLRWLAVGHPRLEAVTLYQLFAGKWVGVGSGLQVALQNKPTDAVGVVLPMTLAAGESRTVLLRVHSRTALDLNARLWQPTAYLQADDKRQLMIAAGAGGSLIVAFISLTVFAQLRQSTYLYFSLLHLFTSLLELGREGLWERFLWPTNLPLPIQAHIVAGIIGILSLMLVQREFLAMKTAFPRWDKLFFAFALAILVAGPMSAVNYPWAIQLIATGLIAVSVASLAIAMIAWRRGSKTAGYLVLGYSITWVLEGLRDISTLGIVNIPFTSQISLTWALLLAAPMFFLALGEHTRTLRMQLRKSDALSRAKSDFLAQVSHELHSPLNTIIGYARLLRRGSARLPLQEGTADIERNGVRLLAMIDELLDQSRLEAGQLSLRPQPLALSIWLAEVERAGRVAGEAAGNTFALTRHGELPAGVQVDAPRLRQILDNLVSNANRHTRQGHVELRCAARKADATDQVMLQFWVKDSGEGIEPEDLQHVFEPFFQGKHGADKAARKGMGLGLAIAYRLVTLMGGKLGVESLPGVGSTFSFGIPCPTVEAPEVLEAAEVAEAAMATSTPGVPLYSSKPTLRVLLVDDDPAALNTLADAAEFLSCAVDSVASGNQAVAALARDPQRWDLVITDQVMDDGDGWHVLQYVRAHRAGLPVVLVSGINPHRPAGLPAQIAFDAFLSKPVEPSKLAHVLVSVVPKLQPPTKPDAARLADLLRLVRLGEISDMEDWCVALETEVPACAAYAQQVRQAARQLDFVQLEALARG